MFRRVVITAAMALGLSAAASADLVTFVDAPTSVNDGYFYVLPYQVTYDGMTQNVICYDDFDDVSNGEQWNANFLTLTQAAATGYFSGVPDALEKYEEVAYLSTLGYANNDQEIGLQYAIWDVFGDVASFDPAYSTYQQYEVPYQAMLQTEIADNFADIASDNFAFIEQVNGVAGQGAVQAFIFETGGGGNGNLNPVVPEPGALGLAGIGVTLLAMRRSRQRK